MSATLLAAALPFVAGEGNTPKTREDLIDEFGELDRQVKQFKPRADRHEALKRIIKNWYEGHPADQTAIAIGNAYEIQISAKPEERKWISMFKLYRALKRERFFAICEVALTKAEELLGKPMVAGLVVKANTGSRRLTPVLRDNPAA